MHDIAEIERGGGGGFGPVGGKGRDKGHGYSAASACAGGVSRHGA
jgi:hypothetical protein